MNAVKILTFISALICATELCSAQVSLRFGEACLVQLLKASENLGVDFPSPPTPPSPLMCYYVTELSMQMVKSSTYGEIQDEIPDHVDCVTLELEAQRGILHIIKILLIENSKLLTDNEKEKQLADARNDFTEILNTIATNCHTDKFVQIFNTILGVKNETVEFHQTIYCLAKYVSDQKLMTLDGVHINPQNIDLNSINCENILDVERLKAERQMRNIIAGLPVAGRSVDCIMNAYKTSEAFGFQAIGKVLHHSKLSKEIKDATVENNGTAFHNFLVTSISTCAKSTRN